MAASKVGLTALAGLVRADAVTYRYPQNDHGLSPVSLTVELGDKLLVAGPSGCGKSTLARCLTGIIPHLYHGTMHGEVWLDGLRTADTPLWRISERGGLVFQNPAAQMLGPSVEEEILFGLENRLHCLWRAGRAARLADPDWAAPGRFFRLYGRKKIGEIH